MMFNGHLTTRARPYGSLLQLIRPLFRILKCYNGAGLLVMIDEFPPRFVALQQTLVT
jgi:hypothetical protein